ncbi:MAG: hypothetical protein N6V41_01560, partial [Candidatus Portiera aleyrodidarum]|nr:hypothetical protein [Candidatus Portiera aleyrodidarum]
MRTVFLFASRKVCIVQIIKYIFIYLRINKITRKKLQIIKYYKKVKYKINKIRLRFVNDFLKINF